MIQRWLSGLLLAECISLCRYVISSGTMLGPASIPISVVTI